VILTDHSRVSKHPVRGLLAGLAVMAAALPLLWWGSFAQAQTMVTPEEAAQLVQAQTVAGDQTDAAELEAAAASSSDASV